MPGIEKEQFGNAAGAGGRQYDHIFHISSKKLELMLI